MGIRGLSSLIENEPNFFESVKLHNTLIIIDGKCISSWLFKRFCPKSCTYNGDYDAYAQIVEIFFLLLKKCNIVPIVILDGGHEFRKLKCVVNRMEESTSNIKGIKNINSGLSFLPLLLVDTFKNVMARLNVQFFQSLLEADSDIVKVAQFMKCPVLSLDSDFYLFDVVYLPFSYFNLESIELKEKNKLQESNFYISVKRFHRDNFLKKFGGLPELSFLSLSSFLLGNDYYDVKIFSKFFEQISEKNNRKYVDRGLSSKIFILFKWFRNIGSPNLAVKKIVELIPAKTRKGVRKELERCLDETLDCKTNYLIQYLQQFSLLENDIDPSGTNPTILDTAEKLKWLNEAHCFLSSCIATPTKNVEPETIPSWVLQYNIEGRFHSAVMDLLLLKTLFLQTQMENFCFSSANSHIFQVFQQVAGILFNEHAEKYSLHFCAYVRIGNNIGKKYFPPLFPDNSVTLTAMPCLSLNHRENILLNIFRVKNNNFDKLELPDNWKLYLVVLAYWYKTENSSFKIVALGSVIFSSIFLSVIDKKVGYFTSETLFLEKHSETLKEIVNRDSKKLGFGNQKMNDQTIIQAIDEVSYNDSILAVKNFISLRNFNSFYDKLFRPILHLFAQIQNCFFMGNIVNSVLNFPVPLLQSADIFCGTLAYNISFEIKSHKSLESFVNARFCELPTVKELFLRIVTLLEYLCKCSIFSKSLTASKDRSKNQEKNSKNKMK